MSQKSRVLSLLEQRGPEGFSADEFFAPNVVDGGKPLTRVAARVCELRDEGHTIMTFTEPSGVARYILVKETSVKSIALATGDDPEPGLFDTSAFNTRRSWEDEAA